MEKKKNLKGEGERNEQFFFTKEKLKNVKIDLIRNS